MYTGRSCTFRWNWESLQWSTTFLLTPGVMRRGYTALFVQKVRSWPIGWVPPCRLKSPIVVMPALLPKLQEELDCKKCDNSVFCGIHFCLVNMVEEAFLTYVGVWLLGDDNRAVERSLDTRVKSLEIKFLSLCRIFCASLKRVFVNSWKRFPFKDYLANKANEVYT